jgi:hypothetical protein
MVLLCGHHHRLIHRSDWVVRLGLDRQPEFFAPVDKLAPETDREPPIARRNPFRRRT